MTLGLMDRLTKEDRASLEAAKKGMFRYDATRTRVEMSLSQEMVASLKMAGLGDDEIEVCQEWAGLSMMAGVSEECRYAKWVLDKAPLPDKLGVLDKQRFWEQMGLGGRLDFLWEAVHFLERFSEPQTVLGRIALKVLNHWRAFARENWPTAAELLQAARYGDSRASTKNRKMAETVGLAALWRMAMDLEKVWHGRSHRPEVDPEDLYEALGPLKQHVEIDCWTRDDETMLHLLKKNHNGHGCSFCDLYSLDGYGFGFCSDGTTSCPRCGFVSSRQGEAAEPVTWDGGPTPPERGGFAYRWAVKHGYMWDEFLEKVVGREAGFDRSRKALCPLVEKCNTHCAQDQRSGVRGWPLGSSDYEQTCYKFREIVWCQENGGTPEQFKEVERRRLERLTNDMKRKARQQRKAAQKETPAVESVEEQQPKEEQPVESVQMSLL